MGLDKSERMGVAMLRFKVWLTECISLALVTVMLTCGGCVHKAVEFSAVISHDKKNVYFEQEMFSKGSYNYKMGPPAWGDNQIKFTFQFELKDISSIYYAYISIATWDVDNPHPIFLNGKRAGYLKRNLYQNYHDGGGGANQFISPNLEATQFYLPKAYFVKGTNTLTIDALVASTTGDQFAIGGLDIVIVRVQSTDKSNDSKLVNVKTEKSFPESLDYLSSLTNEELYIAMVHLPSVITEINFDFGIRRKELFYVLSRIGDYYKWNGNYTKNLEYQKKAILNLPGDSQSLDILFLKAQLGLAYYYMGKYDAALREYKDVLRAVNAIDKKTLETDSTDSKYNLDFVILTTKAYMALLFYSLNDYGSAMKYAEMITDKNSIYDFEKNISSIANSLGNQILGRVSVENGKLQRSLFFFKKALYALNDNPGINHDYVVMTKLYLAHAYYMMGEYTSAIKTINEVKNPTHEFKWKSKLLLGQIEQKRGRYDIATQQFAQSIEEIEQSRAKLSSHSFKIKFMNDKQAPYQHIIHCYNQLRDHQSAFKYVEKSKARAFIDMISGSKDYAYRKNTRLVRLSQEEKRLRKKLIDMQNRISNERNMFKERGVNPETKSRLSAARSALSDFYASKATQNLNFVSLNTTSTLALDEVMQLLADDITLVEYYYDAKYMYAWVIDRKRHRFFKKDISTQGLGRLTESYRRLVLKSVRPRGVIIPKSDEQAFSHNKRRLDEVTRQLGSILLKDIFEHITTEKVCIVPHGILHYLPFQGIKYGSNYLIEKHQIVYMPSATALKYVLAKKNLNPGSLLALGNPQLKAEAMQLPYAENEVKALQKYYPQGKILTRSDASEFNLKKFAGKHGIIHIASHGEFSQKAPLLSSLRLSEGNGEDGRLETREIFGLDLNADLVILSACNTAIGALSKGDDVVGLSRAFIFAGTPSVLGTIWSVNDQSTSVLMNNFYEAYRNNDKMKALRQAQQAMIRSREYNHPYYWAGFKLVGDYN